MTSNTEKITKITIFLKINLIFFLKKRDIFLRRREAAKFFSAPPTPLSAARGAGQGAVQTANHPYYLLYLKL
jgi:hypothetical protein